MPEIINSLFGRTRNEAATSGEDVAASPTQTDSTYSGGADIVVTDEAGGTNAIEVKPTETQADAEAAEPTDDVATSEDVAEDTETAPSADDVAETTEADLTSADDTEDSADAVESDNADDDEPVAEAAIETPAEESDKAVTDEDLTAEAAAEDDENAEDDGSAEDIKAEDAPAVAETDADDVDEAAPVVAETRPAAGSRGNVTVGDGVVVKVVNIVAGKIEGVHSLDDDGISVEVEDDVATIKVSLALEFGYAIKALAERIRVDVIEAVEQFLGLDVAAVDVHVSDIHPPSAA